MSSNEGLTNLQAPRIGHKKSRTGCIKCRARRVKCDEARPSCRNCTRLGLQCRFTGSPVPAVQSEGGSASSSPPSIPPTPASERFFLESAQRGDGEVGEHPKRRMMELQLLQFWMSKPVHRQGWGRIWLQDVPRLAVKNEHLLYALFALAATQLSAVHPGDEELASARQTYWTLALRQQRHALGKLDSMDRQSVAFAAHLIALNAYCMLKQRPMKPYTPPLEWFAISQGAQAISTVGNPCKDTLLQNMMEILAPITDDNQKEADMGVDPEYQRILDSNLSPNELLTFETIRPYKTALRHISSFRRALVSGEPTDLLTRRVVVFPYLVPGLLTLLQEQRPRALVVLACFFGLVSQSGTGAIYGDRDYLIPRTEVAAIDAILPSEWKELMVRPMEEAFGKVRLLPETTATDLPECSKT